MQRRFAARQVFLSNRADAYRASPKRSMLAIDVPRPVYRTCRQRKSLLPFERAGGLDPDAVIRVGCRGTIAGVQQASHSTRTPRGDMLFYVSNIYREVRAKVGKKTLYRSDSFDRYSQILTKYPSCR